MSKSLPKLNILFVDDSLTEVNYLKLLFQITDDIPLNPTFIISAPKALEVLTEAEEGEFPDIVIVDINMPLMTGFEFAEKYYTKFHVDHPETLLFIYSTSIHSADINKAESTNGSSGFIPKPFGEHTFKDYILPHLNKRARG